MLIPTLFPRPPLRIAIISAAVAAIALLAAAPARADDRAELEQLRATTTALIQALVDQGLLSRERADPLLRQAAPRPTEGSPVMATAASASAPTTTARATPPVVRVPYLPESLRQQIKDDIKLDVLATAREEGWADSRQLPPWLRALTFSGDIRLRLEDDVYAKGNVPAEVYRSQTESPAWSPDLTNTQTDRQRITLRARFGVNAKISDEMTAGLRVATNGTSSGATSESQTLGTDFNRLAIGIDRAFMRWEPRYNFRVEGGRIANPFFGSDLLWPDDLSLDGIALSGEQTLASGAFAFATLGGFALEELPLRGADKWLLGAQVGADVSFGNRTQLRLGAAIYDFRNIEGVRETALPPSGARVGTVPYLSSQYSTSLRLRGNTLININDPTSTATPTWGLASKFRPINLTAQLQLRQFDPTQVTVVADYVKNSAFDIADIRRRAGTDAVNDLANRTTGIQLRLQAGTHRVADKGDWMVYATLRKFERDAWVDGLTDTTWNLGGTNYKGYGLGGAYAFDRNSTIGLRWTSTRNLDDGRRFLTTPGDPTSLSGNLSSAPLKIDVIQLEVNSRF
jgi:hypothetical protein